MTRDRNSEANLLRNGMVDITETVHQTMVSPGVKTALIAHGTLAKAESNVVLRGLFPCLQTEARFWFLATGKRGAILCMNDRIHYVTRKGLMDALRPINSTTLLSPVKSYQPYSEAVVILKCDDIWTVAICGVGNSMNIVGFGRVCFDPDQHMPNHDPKRNRRLT